MADLVKARAAVCIFPACERPHRAFGLCHAHYTQARRGQQLRKHLEDLTPEARFWAKVRKSDGCWEWTGSRNPEGYGHTWDDGRSEKAHRLSWKLKHGKIPDGLCVLHRCDNPPCVNPEHLFLGTKKDNSDDKITKGRFRHGNNARPIFGERNGKSKLTDAEVVRLRELRAAGADLKDLAVRFGITRAAVGFIAAGEFRVAAGGPITPRAYSRGPNPRPSASGPAPSPAPP